MAPSTISRSATRDCGRKWTTSRRSFTPKRQSSWPIIAVPARSWRRSARSTANCCAGARRFKGLACAKQLRPFTHRSMWDGAAYSSPICSLPGSTAIQRFCLLRRRLMNPKIQEHHRSKPAYIYLRQSTPSQVRHHQESTERQYALREKALELGWSESLIRTLDRDLGKTGTEMAGLVFSLLRETGSTYGVTQRCAESGLCFPNRSYGGAWDGQILWGRLTPGRVLGMLKNPCYPRIPAFGRHGHGRPSTAKAALLK